MKYCSFLLLLVCAACARTYSGVSASEEAMYRSLDRYGKEFAKENNLELLIVGNATDDQEIIYCLTWRSQKVMTLAEAKKIVPAQISHFVAMLQNSNEVEKFIRYAATHYPYKPKTFEKKHVAWRLVFWNTNIERKHLTEKTHREFEMRTAKANFCHGFVIKAGFL